MLIHTPTSRAQRRKAHGWSILIAALLSTLLVTNAFALPIISEHPGLESVSYANQSLLVYNETDYANQRIQARHLQLDSRDINLKKALIRIALFLNPDWAVLGFAYLDPEVGNTYYADGYNVDLWNLELPAMKLGSKHSPGFMYILPRLGLPAQSLDNDHWSCLVYASKREIKKNKPQMLFRERPPDSENQRNTPTAPVESITFQRDPRFEGVTTMMISTYASVVGEWELLAECYKSPNILPKVVTPNWNDWKADIAGLPKDYDLVRI
ncbi:hypothetical protein J3R30DRAFT_2958710 [Lentinula aciculospora]|uniref:Uncharacterized protein n=1 Tax=Lentinula aciculospora TaxID=153920 RepID=A0A9W8ZS11_9AGAR|nr:hypothetical protein J3R30DRAFT_2958710 [Lentinula aciculospora]